LTGLVLVAVALVIEARCSHCDSAATDADRGAAALSPSHGDDSHLSVFVGVYLWRSNPGCQTACDAGAPNRRAASGDRGWSAHG